LQLLRGLLSIVANDPENAPIGEDPAIDSLEDRIAAARKAEDERIARDHKPLNEGHASGMQVISTMVGYPLGGILIGIFLDNVFETLPWITIALMFLAFIGACIHVMRMIKKPAE
jgi:ATP synthase protein I